MQAIANTSSLGSAVSPASSSALTYAARAGEKSAAPQVQRSNPAIDQTAIDTQAAQDAEKASLDQKRRARANSLLSSYGGQGDTSATEGGAGAATGKLTLGA